MANSIIGINWRQKMGFDNVKQKVVDVFHHTKETTIDIQNNTVEKQPEDLPKPNLMQNETEKLATENAERVSNIPRQTPRKTVQVIDGITARVKHS